MADQFLRLRPNAEIHVDNGFKISVHNDFIEISHKDNSGLYVKIEGNSNIEVNWRSAYQTGLAQMNDFSTKKLEEILPAGTLLSVDLKDGKVIGLQLCTLDERGSKKQFF